MMGGGGSMMGAIISLKNNLALRNKAKRSEWKNYLGTKDEVGYDPIKSTPEQLEAIRIRMQLENKKRKKHQILLAFLSLIAAILIIYLVSNLHWVGIQPDF
ncbi:hypothetical protein [Flavobacterium channae]|uniref:hypothetical protein n=1 Tax=Flavobacterium channae TaxID=2897181 RepID=UPI001E3022BA|nr:hypothetical protein [Flavobacterium channae]UGS22952.1 hypothetical protein LOS89_09260 [Flavobacterium channae]